MGKVFKYNLWCNESQGSEGLEYGTDSKYSGEKMKLRDYQKTAIEELQKSLSLGNMSPLLVLPCGGGKSVICGKIAKRASVKGNFTLFIVHRIELVNQIKETFSSFDIPKSMYKVAMVQTVTRNLESLRKPDLIITDEGHHGLAKTYRRIYEYFSDVPRISVTATPIRMNGSGLGDVNDDIIEIVDAEWLIENGYLSPYRYYAPKLIDTEQLKLNSLREFSNASINNALGNTIYGDVIKHYRELADGEQAIAYCHSIGASKEVEQAFIDHGINAKHIDAKTPKVERDEIIQKFRDREIQVLTNVDLIGEGFDVPDCSTVIMLRPTQSLSLYIQQSMRGMRYRPGKVSIIIDHVDNARRHGLPDMKRHWSLKGNKKRTESHPEIKIRECINCFSVYSPTEVKCPECGHVPVVEKETTYEVDQDAELEEITKEDIEVTLDFREPSDCKTMGELMELAKNRGYKPGWAYFQAKHLGII